MKKITSAAANKILRKLREDKEYWLSKERESQTYVAAVDEEPVIPEYSYEKVSAKIAAIDAKTVKIKHAINLANINSIINVNGEDMTIDMALIRMAQLNSRKETLDAMRKRQPKTRVNNIISARRNSPEYEYVNYDLDTVDKDFEKIDAEIMEIQMALDKYNQTVEFEMNYH